MIQNIADHGLSTQSIIHEINRHKEGLLPITKCGKSPLDLCKNYSYTNMSYSIQQVWVPWILIQSPTL
jgi:hypothetical protein